jgi:hypothetical protein
MLPSLLWKTRVRPGKVREKRDTDRCTERGPCVSLGAIRCARLHGWSLIAVARNLFLVRVASTVTWHGPSQNSCCHSPCQRAPTPCLHVISRVNSRRLASRFTWHGPSRNSSFHSPRHHRSCPRSCFQPSPSAGLRVPMPTTIKTPSMSHVLISSPRLRHDGDRPRFFPLAERILVTPLVRPESSWAI